MKILSYSIYDVDVVGDYRQLTTVDVIVVSLFYWRKYDNITSVSTKTMNLFPPTFDTDLFSTRDNLSTKHLHHNK